MHVIYLQNLQDSRRGTGGDSRQPFRAEVKVSGALTQRQRVLVTGGAGFIGSHLVDQLVADGHNVLVLDNLSTGSLQNLKRYLGARSFQFMKGDLRDRSALRTALRGVEVVFHEAAQVNVFASIADPILTNDVNVKGTLNLLEASAKSGVRRLISASSSSVYGEYGMKRLKEDFTPRPRSPYAVSKLAAEGYCLAFSRLGKLETASLRYFNVYGPRRVCRSYGGVVTAFLRRVLNNEAPIIHGDGRQTRDFVHVRDVVEANMLAMNANKADGQVFNIGTGVRTSIRSLAKMIIDASGKKNVHAIHAPLPSEDLRHNCANIEKASRMLGYSPSVVLRDSLSLMVKNGERH